MMNFVALHKDIIQMFKSFLLGILPYVVQLPNHMGHVSPHHLESNLLLSHDFESVGTEDMSALAMSKISRKIKRSYELTCTCFGL